jgi:hypothetical protein
MYYIRDTWRLREAVVPIREKKRGRRGRGKTQDHPGVTGDGGDPAGPGPVANWHLVQV